MRAEIINVGTELLLGDIVNLNSRYLSKELATLGIGVYYQTSVGDNPVRLKKVLASAVSRSNIIILTGGLGPTADDITKETISAALGIPLVEDEASLKAIEEYFAASGREMPEANRKQALCPRGAVVFKNLVGTAPGYALSAGKQHIILLPGPPSELKSMFENSVSNYLSKLSSGVILSKEVRIFGMGESEVAEKVSDLLEMSNPTVAPYAKNGEVELRVTAKDDNTMKAHSMCMKIVDEIQNRLGQCVYTHTYANLQETVVALLKEKEIGLSTAESCTAGLLSSRITEVPGASQIFGFGAVAYSNEIKKEILDVREETLEEYGAVSEQTAMEMAIGARIKGNTKLGVAITGVAGPQASERKPVGLVYVALCDESHYWCRELHLNHKAGDREAIRNLSAMNALDMVRLYLQGAQLPDGKEYAAKKEVEKEFELPEAVPFAEEKGKEMPIEVMKISNDEYIMPIDEDPEEGTYVSDAPNMDYGYLGVVVDEDEINTQKANGLWAQVKLFFSSLAARFSNNSEEESEEAEATEQTFTGMDFIFYQEEDEISDVEALEAILTEEEPEDSSLPQEEIEEEIEENVETEEELPSAEEIVDEESEEIEVAQGNETESEEIEVIEENELESEESTEENDDSDVVILSKEEDEQDMAKENNLFKRIAKIIIPLKGDSKGEIIRKSIFLLCMAVFIGSAIYLISFFADQSRNNHLINNVRDQWQNVAGDNTVAENGIYNRFQFLLEQNPDVIGWVKIDNSNIDNPVYQSDDLLYYEDHNMAGETSRYGAIFAHPDCYIDQDTVSRNITLYGHNTKDGSMFANLTKYRLSGHFRRNPIIKFDTIYREGTYKIFAAMIVNAYPAQDSGYAYDYDRTTFSSDLDFAMWLDEAQKRSMYNTGVDVDVTDEILTLSTCVYDFEEARLIIMARRLRDGESTEINPDEVYDKGPATLYPQAYYDVYGGAKPNYYDR